MFRFPSAQSLRLITTAKILSTGEPHVHLRSSLPNAVPCRVSTSTTFCLFLFSFFSRRSPLALVTIIGSIAPPHRSLPISLFGCAVPSSFPLVHDFQIWPSACFSAAFVDAVSLGSLPTACSCCQHCQLPTYQNVLC